MPQQIINIGTVAGDGTGDALRESQRKTNENFSEIYTRYAPNLGTVIPTDTPTGTGINYWECIEAGTYTNFGGVVLGANSRGTIFRNLSGVFSISQVAYDITSKVNVSDVINTLSSSETAKPLSAAQGKILNEKNVKIETWTAKAYLSGDQVNHLGKDWVSNADTVAGDIPGTSSKWVERLNVYTKTESDLTKKNVYDILGEPVLTDYPNDFSLITNLGGANIKYINNVPITIRGKLHTFSIKAVIGSTITPYAYSISGSNGSFVFTELHVYASFITTTLITDYAINDDYVLEVGQFIGFKSSLNTYYMSSVNGAYSPPVSSYQAVKLACAFKINTNLNLGMKGDVVTLNTKVTDINAVVGAPNLVNYPINFTPLVDPGCANIKWANYNPVANDCTLKSLRIKTVSNGGAVVTAYVYSNTGTKAAPIFNLKHTYAPFTATAFESTNVYTDRYIIKAGELIFIKSTLDYYYVGSGESYQIGLGSLFTASLSFDFKVNENILDFETRLFKIEQPILSQFSGKRVVVEGDSIMADGFVTGDVATRTGCNIINLSSSGTGYVWGGTTIRSRVVNIVGQTPDCVFICGGTNDWKTNKAIGSKAVLNDDTQFYSAVYNTFRVLREQNLTVPVLIATPIQRAYNPDSETKLQVNSLGLSLLDYANVIKEVAALFSFQVVDLFANSGITYENRNTYTYDGLHANALGGKLMGGKIAQFMNNLIIP